MGLGESLVDFLARMNNLMEEATRLGEDLSQSTRMVMIATKLREPWRTMANDKMDRDKELTYNTLVQHLMLRSRGEIIHTGSAYLATQQHGQGFQS